MNEMHDMNTMGWRCKPFARAIVWLNCWMMIATASSPLHAAPPARNALPKAATNWVQAGSATQVINGNTMTINQGSNKAILDWENFNIGSDAAVQFNQPSAASTALNRIHDSSPSQIFGRLGANGNVYLINHNGVVFGSGSQVNVRGLVVSTLDITNEKFLNGTLGNAIASGQAAFEGGTAADASVVVESGANIKTEAGGQVLMFAPTVENRGNIETPDGQTLLAASKNKVYLVNSDQDSDLRGLLVEVDTGGDVNNVGSIVAERGNITLLGLAVNQNGRVRATTSVDVNGSVRLIARDGANAESNIQTNKDKFVDANFLKDASEITQTAGTFLPIATRTGKVTLGQGSVTEVVADNSGKTATDSAVQPQSRIQLMGETIELKNNALVKTPAGQVDLVATKSLVTIPKVGNRVEGEGRIYLGENSRIDVSGEKVVLSADRRVIEVELRGDELKDAPLQRNGKLRGEKVKVDINKGSPLIADLSPWLARVQKGASERMTQGGTVNLLAAGDVVMSRNAGIDISGGSVTYASGLVNTSKLLSRGRIIDIGDASANRIYDGIFGAHDEIHPKWGKLSFGENSVFARGTFEEAYTDGANGGLLNIETPILYGFDGLKLDAHVQQGSRQRAEAIVPGASRVAIDVRVGSQVQNVVMSQQVTSINAAVDTVLPNSANGRPVLNISAEQLNRSGLRSLTLNTYGSVLIDGSVDLAMVPNSSLIIEKAGTIQLDGKLRLAGGTVKLAAGNLPEGPFPDLEAQYPLTLGAQALIDVSGLWTNDQLALTQKRAPTDRVMLKGGTIELNADGDLNIAAGAKLKADAGGWLSTSGDFTGGDGGSITLISAAQTPSNIGSRLLLSDDALSAYGFGKNGALTLSTGQIIIGAPANNSSTLALAADFFNSGRFSKYDIKSTLRGLSVADGTRLDLSQRNFVLRDPRAAAQLSSEGDIRSITTISSLPDADRVPVDLTLTAVRAPSNDNLDSSPLRIGTGSSIRGEAGARIVINGDDTMFINCTISAPGGSISVALSKNTKETLYRPELMIWFGENAHLFAGATSELIENDQGLLLHKIYDAGSISVKADRGAVVAAPGSMFDVKGETFEFDRPRIRANHRWDYIRATQHGAAGSIDFTAAESLAVYGDLNGASSGDGLGGSLSFRLDRNNRETPTNLTGGMFPFEDLVIDLYGELPEWGGWSFGGALPASLRSHAPVGANRVMAGGFSSLTLGAANVNEKRNNATAGNLAGYGVVRAASDIAPGALVLRDTLTVDAVELDVNGKTVNLAAGSVLMGQDDPGEVADLGAPQKIRAPTVGVGVLNIDAQFIELLGNLSLTHAHSARINSTGDIRLRSHIGLDSANGNKERILAPAKLQTAGDLHLQAAQIYPTTLTDYTVQLTGVDSVFSTSRAGARTPILSAGGSLKVLAPHIEHGGVLAAPLGQILLGNADTRSIDLLAGSTLDVSASTLIPFGRLRGDIDWIYPILATAPLVIGTVPEKRVELQADAIDMQSGSRIEVSGGGDITAFEFIAGPGGSRDFLDTANAKGGFAVVPWLNSVVAPYDAIEMMGSGIALGQTIYLEGGNGLPAGNYAVLPAHYALLPGAYLITPTNGTWSPGQQATTVDGTFIAAGRLGRAFSGQYAGQWTGYSIEGGAAARLRSQYNEATGNAYFTDGIHRARDAGHVVVDANTALRLNGLIGAESQNGRGAQLDIIADAIEVVEEVAQQSGVIQLAADALNALGVDSLMLGGRRAQTGDDTTISVSANSVAVRDGATLAVPDLILVARDNVQLDSGARITGTGQSQVDTNRFVLSGDGALLRASTGKQADVVRTNTSGTTGNLTLSAGSEISGARSVLVDATANTTLQGSLGLEQGSLNLTANRISLGDAPANTTGVVFTSQELAALNAKELRLSSRSTIDFYGNLNVANDYFQLNAGALRSMANSDATVSSAGTLQLSNAANVQNADAANAGGTLRLAGSRIELGNERDKGTAMSVRGFDRVELGAQQSTREIVGQGVFTLNTGGDIVLTADRITVASTGNSSIISSGVVSTVRANTANSSPDLPSLGGKLNITANRIDHGGVIDLSSGVLELIANGASADADVNLLAGSQINVSGRSIAAPEGWVSSSAGKILLRSDNGNVNAAAGANVNLDGGAHGGNAGTLTIKSPNGTVNWLAATSARATNGAKGGSIDLTKNNLADIDQWLGLIGASGFDQVMHLRSRSGDVAINTAIKAADFEVSADNGSLLLNSAIDARGEKGGRVGLYASADLALTDNAHIDASATAATGKGGRVELGIEGENNQAATAGRLSLAAGSVIDVAGGNQGRNGRVQLRAPRVAGDTDVAIDIAAGASISGAEAVVVEAVKVYDSAVIDAAFITGALADADAFMTNSAAIAQRLAMAGLSLRPGIEVRSSGDISIADTIDFAAVRYGMDVANRVPGDPGVLTLRAAGDVIFTGSLRDGLIAESDPTTVDEFGNPLIGLNMFTGIPNMLLLPGESWQYRAAAGADLTSANPLDVRDGEGNLRLQGGADVITGAADIQLVAGDSVISDLVDSVVASLGLSAYSEQSAGLIDPSIDLGGWLPDTGTIESWILAWGYGYKRLLYPEQGGDVSIRAGTDIRFAKAADSGQQEHFFSDWIARIGGDDLQVAQIPGVTNNSELTTWGIFASYFHYGDQWNGSSSNANAQGIAVLGGGDLTLDAGRDILNLNAALPTTGKQVGAVNSGDVLPGENVVRILGGGNLSANAGRDIVSPRILVDKGEAALAAGRDIRSADGLNALVTLGDARLSAAAVGDIVIGSILSSTTMPQSEFLNTTAGSAVALENYFFNYTDASRISLTSTAGDISLVNEAAAIRATFGNRFAGSNVYDRVSGGGNDSLWMLLPGTLDAYALTGNIGVNGAITLFPSASGNLHLFAGSNISFTSIDPSNPSLVRMAEVPGSELPFYQNPANSWFDGGSPQQGIFASGAAARLFSANVAPLTFTPTHVNDSQHNWITALNGDIDSLNAVLPKQTRIYAGRDVIDANLDLQHANQNSISEIVAGRDIRYGLPINADGSPPGEGKNRIRVSGPGRLDVIAGRDISFGVTPGIQSIGNSLSNNFAMAESGADVTVMTGINNLTAITSDELYNTFAQRYFSDIDLLDTSYIDWFAAGNFGGDAQKLVSVFTGQAYSDKSSAIAAFNNLSTSMRQIISLEAYQLQKAGAQSATSATGYAAAGGHRAAYSAELIDFVSSARFAGDLAKHVSAITGISYANNSDAAAALASLPAAQQHTIARAALDDAPLLARREIVLDTLTAEVRKGGVEKTNGFLNRNIGAVGFERSNEALALLFPGDSWQGDLALAFSALKTNDDGDINIFTPGGKVDVGLAGTFAGFVKSADQLGIVSSLYGAINILAKGDINVNASRVFSLDGAAVTLWSSEGDIDAGKGAKTAASVPPPQFRLRADGTIETLFPPSLTGSGIQALNNDYKTAVDLGPFQTGDILVERQRYFRSLSKGNSYLFAPQGKIDAGDAGIAVSGNLLLAAQAVVGADNISVGGVAIGIPTTSSVSAGTLSMGNSAASATESATGSMNEAIKQTAAALAESKVAFVTVDVIGVGR